MGFGLVSREVPSRGDNGVSARSETGFIGAQSLTAP